ncbi:MAG: glycosyltransferase family 2 protein [Pseudomonadota bacterium]
MNDPITILIPAHNEARVIGDTLARLHDPGGERPDDMRIIVIANGCDDDTVSIVTRDWPQVSVVDLPEPSKVKALKAGIEHHEGGGPLVILDADIQVSLADIRALVAPLWGAAGPDKPVLAAVGHFEPDYDKSHWPVRWFYRAWRLHPYFDGGKFGGCYGLHAQACPIVKAMPVVINDDEYIARQIKASGAVVLTSCRFATAAPVTLAELIRVRSRVARGNQQLIMLAAKGQVPTVIDDAKPGLVFLKRLVKRPSLWPGFVVYMGVKAGAAIRNRWHHRQDAGGDIQMWERVSR